MISIQHWSDEPLILIISVGMQTETCTRNGKLVPQKLLV